MKNKQLFNLDKKRFTIIKKIAKHGKQAIIVIPRILESELVPGTIAEVQINVIKEVKEDENEKD